MAVVVTVAKGYDLSYIWKTQGQASGERTPGGYYINAAQAGEPPGRWWGPGAQALGFAVGQVVERKPYDAVYRQRDPRTRERLGRSRGIAERFDQRHGKGSHGTLHYGNRKTTVKDPQKEIGMGLLRDMLGQLGLSRRDLDEE